MCVSSGDLWVKFKMATKTKINKCNIFAVFEADSPPLGPGGALCKTNFSMFMARQISSRVYFNDSYVVFLVQR